MALRFFSYPGERVPCRGRKIPCRGGVAVGHREDRIIAPAGRRYFQELFRSPSPVLPSSVDRAIGCSKKSAGHLGTLISGAALYRVAGRPSTT